MTAMASLKSLLLPLLLSISLPILSAPTPDNDPLAFARNGIKRIQLAPLARSNFPPNHPRPRQRQPSESDQNIHNIAYLGNPKGNDTTAMIPTFNKRVNYTQSWSYGCYTEPGGHDAHAHPRRALTGPSYIAQHNMTLDTCESFCVGSGYSLWGVEYGGECYCGNHLSHGSFPTFPDDCDLPCPGDAHEYCGGLNRLSLYGSEPYPPKVIASSHPAVYKHRFLGCWTEGEGSRALLGPRVTSARFMTVERCGNFCIDSGYTGFGLEYGSECYCGNELAKSSKICDAKECNMECSGKEGEVCGGRDTLSLYLWI